MAVFFDGGEGLDFVPYCAGAVLSSGEMMSDEVFCIFLFRLEQGGLRLVLSIY